MEIAAEKFTIEVTYNELWSIAWGLRNDLQNTIKTHWVQFQDNWMQNEKDKLYLINKMFTHLARPDLYDDLLKYANQTFLDYNKNLTP